jgi:DNA-binding IclR family transcriptional regulator
MDVPRTATITGAVNAARAGGHRNGQVQSVDKAVRLLRAFDSEAPDLGVSELARSFGWQKSTISRLLATLQAGGLLEQDLRSGRYRLSPLFMGMGARALARVDLRSLADPYIKALATSTGETVNLVVLSEGECFNLAVVHSNKTVKSMGWVGRRTPLHCTSAGKALLWELSREQVVGLIGQTYLAHTRRTLVTVATLWADLERMRLRGYALSDEEFEDGLTSVSAPVFNAQAQVEGALTVTGPTFRMKTRVPALGAAVRLWSGTLSERLGAPAGKETTHISTTAT